MTDVIPQGTKRRGSTEVSPDDLPPPVPDEVADDNEDSNAVTNPSQSEPNLSNKSKQEQLLFATTALNTANGSAKPNGHRRRNTDGNLRFSASGTTIFKSATNSDVIKLMQSELPPSAKANMQKKANDLKLERELKHLQIKLREAEDQCSTAVEIIGNLQRENEDLVQNNEMLRTQLGAIQTEVKINEQKIQSLEELYQTDTAKYKEEVDSTKKQLSELEEDMNQKDIQLNEAKEYQKSIQQRLSVTNQESGDQNNESGVISKKKYDSDMETLKAQIMDKDGKIEKLMLQLENTSRTEHEREKLQREINSLNEMAQQDAMLQHEQIEKMTSEILHLASRNSALEKEREDLMALLEERDYEAQMLKTGYGLHRSKHTKHDMGDIANQLEVDMEYDENLENLAFMETQNSFGRTPHGDDDEYMQYENSEDHNARDSRSASPKHKKSKEMKPEKEVADVTREYLHLTASVVNMKFPKVRHISSEELINKVKNYQFWEYHDMMVRIMKTEEQKMVAKQKEDEEKQKQSNEQQQPTGMLSRFRNFFGGGADKAKPGVAGRGRHSVAVTPMRKRTGSQQTANTQGHGSNLMTRVRGNTYDVKQAKQEIKKNVDMLSKKAKVVKEQTVKMVTANPTHKEQEELNDMEFQGVPVIGAPRYSESDEDAATKGKQEKPKKPDQGL